MKVRCIAVDDEPLALDIVEEYISKVPFLELAGKFSDGLSALEYLMSNETDLMFLDIEMGGLSGMQLLKSLEKRPYVIMTTAYRDYAADAFDLNVTDYLLKPFTFERFLKAVEKSCGLMSKPKDEVETRTAEEKYFFVKSDGKMVRVNFDEIFYIEGLSEYIIIKTRTSNIITLQSFAKIEESLPKGRFVRIHKSYMVALDKISSVKGQSVSIGGKELPVGDKYKKAFYSIISPDAAK